MEIERAAPVARLPGVRKRKHAELPGEPAASTSVLLTTKVRDRDKGTETEKSRVRWHRVREIVTSTGREQTLSREHSPRSGKAHAVFWC